MSDVIKIHDGERTTAKDWAYVPDAEKPSTWALLINDAGHVRDAMARFNQAQIPEAARHEVARKLAARAKALGIDPSGFAKQYLSAVVMFSAVAAPIPRTRDGKLVVREDGLVRMPIFQMGRFYKGAQEVPITPELVSDIRRNFKAGDWPVPVSYEHTIEHPERAMGQPIPAAGKVREIEAHSDAAGNVFGWIEPTKRALQMLEDGEIEHTSPAYALHLPNIRTGKDQGATLLSLALTNRPFLPTPAITMSLVLPAADETDTTTPAEAGKEQHMRKVKVSAITDGENKGHLSVSHSDFPSKDESGGGYYADAGDVKEALGNAGKVEASADDIAKVITLSGVSATALSSEVVTALAARVAAGASRPPIVELSAVPVKEGRRDYANLTVPAGAAVSGDIFRAWQADVELDAAVASGKLLPAQRADFAKIAEKDIDLFRVTLSALRPQVNYGVAGSGTNAAGGSGETIELTAEEASIAKQMGMDPADVLQEKKRLAGAA